MQYYKRTLDEGQKIVHINYFHSVSTRKHGTIPGCVPAHDIWVFADDPARDPDRLYMTIKNPCKPYRPIY